MTLNITYAVPSGVYQSSDYRLTFSQLRRTWTTDTTYKHLSVSLLGPPSWNAILTYTGVGQFRDTDVMKWLCERLDRLPNNQKTSPDDYIEFICAEASTYVQLRLDPRLTFIVGERLNSQISLTIISNFQEFDSFGRITTLAHFSNRLKISRSRPQGHLLLTGDICHISTAERRDIERKLRSLAGKTENTNAIFEIFQEFNIRAAQSKASISPDCSCHLLLADGSGASIGSPRAPAYLPPELMDGRSMPKLLSELLTNLESQGVWGSQVAIRNESDARQERDRVAIELHSARSAGVKLPDFSDIATKVDENWTPTFPIFATLHRAIVAAPDSEKVFTLDTLNHDILASFDVGPRPSVAIILPDEKSAIVAFDGKQPSQGVGSLALIDTQVGEVCRRASVGTNISNLLLHFNGEVLFAADQFGDRIYSLDIRDLRILGVYPTPACPLSLALDVSGRYLWTACVQGRSLMRIDLCSAETLRIPVEGQPHNVLVHPELPVAYFTNSKALFEINTWTNARRELTLMRQPRDIALSGDGRILLVANIDSAHISVIDTKEWSEVARISVGRNPQGICFCQLDEFAYVINGGSNYISVIDLSKSREVQQIDFPERIHNTGYYIR